jgi:hypothetical protein
MAVPEPTVTEERLGDSAGDEATLDVRPEGEPSAPPPAPPGGPDLAPRREQRVQDRNAALTLGPAPEGVAAVTDEAISITEDVGGIVVSSRLTERDGQARADLQLSIPAPELDRTLDRLTDLAEVTFFSEGAEDITAPFVSARERLADARQERARLLDALGEAGDGAEAESLRKQLRDARQRIARARAGFERIERGARFAAVGVSVEGRDDAGGGWSLGDAADDALAALERLAGIALVAAAILLPLGLALGLLVALRRRSRDRALDC